MVDTQITRLFSQTYAQARQKFLQAATARGLAVESYELPERGLDNETLAMDIARSGPSNASKMLIVLSGVHGVEGFCGSAVQTGFLSLPAHTQDWHDTAVLYVHAVNPFGFSHLRRVTQENVDLNRNFVDFSKPLPLNPGYGEIQEWLLPVEWPPHPTGEAELAAYRERHGARGLQRAVGLGQYAYSDGMFFGGHRPTWSNHTFRQVLQRHVAKVRLLASIDIHTGLGPYGVGERIFASFDKSPGVRECSERWWGDVTSVTSGSSTSIPLTGPIQTAFTEECPNARHVGICLEYGTYATERVTNALRADHWLSRHGSSDQALSMAIQREIKNAFYPDADDWKLAVWRQGSQACLQALKGLQETSHPTATS